MKLGLNIALIVDNLTRTAFERLQQFMSGFTLSNFVCVRIDEVLSAAAYPATLSLAHNLKGVPTDVIQTYVSGGTATWNVASFTATSLSVTISAKLTVRGFIGYYRSDT